MSYALSMMFIASYISKQELWQVEVSLDKFRIDKG